MASVVRSIEVKVPVSTVYNQWTQFEEFPSFIEGRGIETGAWRGDVEAPLQR